MPETLGIEAEKLHDRRLGDLLDALHRHLLAQCASVSAVYSYFGDGGQLRQAAPLTEFQRLVLKRLRFPPPDVYLTADLEQNFDRC